MQQLIRRFLFVFLVFNAPFVFAQTEAEEIERIVKIKPREIEKYVVNAKRVNTLYLETAFNNAVYKDAKSLSTLKDKAIIKVELVYTTYRKSETFDQHGLNRKRLKALFLAAPNCMKQPGIEWILMAQTGCKSAEEGPSYFHGVVVTYRDNPSPVLSEIEQKFLRKVVEGEVPAHAYDAFVKNEFKSAVVDSAGNLTLDKEYKLVEPKFPGTERDRIDYFTRNLKFPANAKKMDQRVSVQFNVDKTGKIKNIDFTDQLGSDIYLKEVKEFVENMPKWSPGSVDGKPSEFLVYFTIEFNSRGSILPSPIKSSSTEIPPKREEKRPPDYSNIPQNLQSKVVTDVLNRSKWSNASLVCDVTASMAPYTAQLMEYLKLQFKAKDTAVRQIVFFNDGDNRSDRSKKVGQVGGVYLFHPKTIDEALENLMQVMIAGSGGDLEENNIEALLKAEAACPSCSHTILIADNVATPRDLSLVSKLTKPVHVVACGSSAVLNENYLTLAYLTKGSLHFMNKDYVDLHLFSEGATVQVGKETYVLKGTKFVRRRIS
ncbi:MAG: energy transducer TonB [Fluviicola sp.]|nr:energy transducer TonB [Fluviicola sp.]